MSEPSEDVRTINEQWAKDRADRDHWCEAARTLAARLQEVSLERQSASEEACRAYARVHLLEARLALVGDALNFRGPVTKPQPYMPLWALLGSGDIPVMGDATRCFAKNCELPRGTAECFCEGHKWMTGRGR